MTRQLILTTSRRTYRSARLMRSVRRASGLVRNAVVTTNRLAEVR
jgi:hypothetical protein